MGVLDKLQSMLQSKKVNVNQRFDLLKEAVSGTMSNFYMARDRTTDEIVGLKVGDKEKVEMFEGRFRGLKKPPEGEIAMKLNHPLVVKTMEHGTTTTNVPYLVMEFLKGAGLHMLLHNRDSVLDGKRLSLIRDMAEALHFVHASGYIHRDVCPRNFICSQEADSIKLIDFGLTLPATKDFMQPGNRTGTPLYMAPEVVRRRWTDKRVDIFAFGVTAYHLCTFDLPWPVAETSGMAALAHDTAPPTDIFQLRPQLNKTLGTAIMRCLGAKPEERPESLESFLRDIRSVKSEDEA